MHAYIHSYIHTHIHTCIHQNVRTTDLGSVKAFTGHRRGALTGHRQTVWGIVWNEMNERTNEWVHEWMKWTYRTLTDKLFREKIYRTLTDKLFKEQTIKTQHHLVNTLTVGTRENLATTHRDSGLTFFQRPPATVSSELMRSKAWRVQLWPRLTVPVAMRSSVLYSTNSITYTHISIHIYHV